MNVILLGLLFIVLSYFQIKKMYKKGAKKDIITYSGLMLLAAYLSIGSIMDFYIPNPTNGLRILFSPIHKFIYGLLS